MTGAPPRFDVEVGRDGYHWFYLDGVSDDGRSSVVLIAMLGNVFSPARVRERRSDRAGSGHALDFCTMNVALVTPTAKRWALTERGRGSVTRTAEQLSIGPSRLSLGETAEGAPVLVATLAEDGAFGSRVRGRIVFHPDRWTDPEIALDDEGRHHWRPHAPSGRIEVELDEPRVRFSGHGYLDANRGVVPLERDFARWSWSRVRVAGGMRVAYDVELRSGEARARGLTLADDGALVRHEALVGAQTAEAEQETRLPPTRFRLPRRIRGAATLVQTLCDSPFYARSLVRTASGEIGMHETVSLERFQRGWVRALLPVRMRREGALGAW